jgi:hypothetical protein
MEDFKNGAAKGAKQMAMAAAIGTALFQDSNAGLTAMLLMMHYQSLSGAFLYIKEVEKNPYKSDKSLTIKESFQKANASASDRFSRAYSPAIGGLSSGFAIIGLCLALGIIPLPQDQPKQPQIDPIEQENTVPNQSVGKKVKSNDMTFG